MRIRKTVTLDTNLEGFANPEDVQKYMDQNDLKTLSAALKSLMDEHHQLSQQVTVSHRDFLCGGFELFHNSLDNFMD